VNREIRVAFEAVAYGVALLLLAIFLLRGVVPTILEARFTGSVLAAAAVGIAGAMGLMALAVLMFGRVARQLRDETPTPKESPDANQ
jgi:uncharacterized membrane protein YidH (DUF202 family)